MGECINLGECVSKEPLDLRERQPQKVWRDKGTVGKRNVSMKDSPVDDNHCSIGAASRGDIRSAIKSKEAACANLTEPPATAMSFRPGDDGAQKSWPENLWTAPYASKLTTYVLYLGYLNLEAM